MLTLFVVGGVSACARHQQTPSSVGPTAGVAGRPTAEDPSASATGSQITVPSTTPSGCGEPWDSDWQHPINALQATTSNARRVGQLSFDPVLPARPGHLLAVYVFDPAIAYPGARAVTFVYDFPSAPDFPHGGQVEISEGEDVATASKALPARAASSPCTRLIKLSSGQSAYQQVTDVDYGGRITFVRGKVVFNIEGTRGWGTARAGILAVADAL